MAVDAQRPTHSAAVIRNSVIDANRSAIRHRGAAVRKASVDVAKPVQVVEDAANSTEDSGTQWAAKVAVFIETIEVQALGVCVIVFDVVSAIASLHLQSQVELRQLQAQVAALGSHSKSTGIARVSIEETVAVATPLAISVSQRMLDTLAGFSIVLFIVELAVLMATFRRRFFTHFGYVLDLAVVVGAALGEILLASKAIRLLGLLRVWRVFRLVGTLLDRERQEHGRTLDALDLEKTRALQLQFEKQAAEESLKREYESRAGIERMLQGYKDEADTLREALNIAAHAVAEATMHTIEEGNEMTERNDVQQSQQEISAQAYGDAYAADVEQYDPQATYYASGWYTAEPSPRGGGEGEAYPEQAQGSVMGETEVDMETEFTDAAEE